MQQSACLRQGRWPQWRVRCLLLFCACMLTCWFQEFVLVMCYISWSERPRDHGTVQSYSHIPLTPSYHAFSIFLTIMLTVLHFSGLLILSTPRIIFMNWCPSSLPSFVLSMLWVALTSTSLQHMLTKRSCPAPVKMTANSTYMRRTIWACAHTAISRKPWPEKSRGGTHVYLGEIRGLQAENGDWWTGAVSFIFHFLFG